MPAWFADRTSAATMRANQLRLWFASMAYVLLCALRRIGLAHSQFADATCGTIRLKLLKIGALVRISVRHQGSDVIRLSLAERIRPRSHTTTLCCPPNTNQTSHSHQITQYRRGSYRRSLSPRLRRPPDHQALIANYSGVSPTKTRLPLRPVRDPG